MSKEQVDTLRKQRLTAFDVVNYIFLALVVAVCLYPFIYIISTSLSDGLAVVSGDVKLFPVNPGLGAYEHVLGNQRLGIARAMFNSVLYTVVGTFVSVLLTYMTAYALSRTKVVGRHAIMFAFIATWIFDAGIVPAYIINEKLGFVDNWLVMVIPPAMSTFLLIVTRSFLSTLPVELEESATVDGANDLQIMFRIYFALSAPVIATISIFYAVQTWNSFLTPLIYLRDKALQPIQVVLYRLLVVEDPSSSNFERIVIDGHNVLPENIRAVTMVLAIVPIIIFYPYAQRYFTKGLMIGSVKG